MSDFNSPTAFSPLSPAERYAQALASGQFMSDEAQAQAVHELDRVWHELIQRFKASKKNIPSFPPSNFSPWCVYVGWCRPW